MAAAESWRSGLFKKGGKYHVLKDWTARGRSFKAGTVVEYVCSGYERYDNESMFLFYQPRGLFRRKAELIWRLRDDEPDSQTREFFREAEG